MSADLAWLLSPIEPAFFFKEYWNRLALYVPGHPAKFAGLFDRAAFEKAAQRCSVLKVNYTDERGWPVERSVSPAEIPDLLACGKTVCAGEVNRNDETLTAFLAEFHAQFLLAGAFHFNAYLSPDGGGFGLHFDNHPVWILQIEGQKRWRYSAEPALPQVVTNVSFPQDRTSLRLPWATIRRPEQDGLKAVVLNPGDILYLPKGAWHQAEAIGGSLGLTLAQAGATPTDILQQALAPHLTGLPFRDLLPAFWRQSTHRELDADLEPRFAQALAALRAAVDSISAAQMVGIWRQAQRSAEPPRGTLKDNPQTDPE
jgi:ribosomal protein L16 Arg81 hydroxylase